MNTRHVIVVDDNDTNRLLPGLFLRPLGYTVHECDSATQALTMLQDTVCDVLLLDISMPTVTSIEGASSKQLPSMQMCCSTLSRMRRAAEPVAPTQTAKVLP